MDDLAKIIFIADKIEEGRKHVNFSEVLEKQDEGLNSLLLYVLDHSIIHVIEKNKTMHPATILTKIGKTSKKIDFAYFLLIKTMI